MKICPHEYAGTLCHLCFPEYHTFLSLYSDGTWKKFVKGGMAEDAVSKALRSGAVEVYKLIKTTQHDKEDSLRDSGEPE